MDSVRSKRLLSYLLWAALAFRADGADEAVRLNEENLPAGAVWLESLNLEKIVASGRKPQANRNGAGQPIKIDETAYAHGVGLSGSCFIRVNLKGVVTAFAADLNPDDGRSLWNGHGAVYVDGRKLDDPNAAAGTKTPPTKIYPLRLDLTGASEMLLVLCNPSSHDFAGARFQLKPGAVENPEIVGMPDDQAALVEDPANVVWLDQLHFALYSSGDGWYPGFRATRDSQPLAIAGEVMVSGYCVYPRGRLVLDLKGNAARFIARVGVNDSTPASCTQAAIFRVYVDKKLAFDSGAMKAGDKAKAVDLDLAGARELMLAVNDSGGSEKGRATAVWAWPRVLVKPGTDPKAFPEGKFADQVPMSIATIQDGPEPALHGPLVAGASPGRPMFYAIPATGEKPLRFAADKLPAGLTLDPASGFVTGVMKTPGRQLVTLSASNARGKASRQTLIVCAPYAMALTPPLGWNSWHQWHLNTDEQKVREAAEAFVTNGFAAHGFVYVNIDDGWEGERLADGTLQADPKKFGDMKALGDFIHAKGLKFGIYSSPGPKTCGGREGSFNHEQQDANLWASWGIDYIKYDQCSGGGLPDLRQRWIDFRTILDNTGRDIVYSSNSCRDEAAKAQLWRTGGDIRSNWMYLSAAGFAEQPGLEKYARPGRFNDPDMLIVGTCDSLGSHKAFSPFPITRNEQITQISLWSMRAAPLLLGCNLAKTDEFLFSLMCNDDVLAIDQDPLVRQGKRFRADPPSESSDRGGEVWTRELFDGTLAVALFNRGCEPVRMSVTWKELGLEGAQPVRDCWQRQDLGSLADGVEARIEVHGAALFKVGTPHPERLGQVLDTHLAAGE